MKQIYLLLLFSSILLIGCSGSSQKSLIIEEDFQGLYFNEENVLERTATYTETAEPEYEIIGRYRKLNGIKVTEIDVENPAIGEQFHESGKAFVALGIDDLRDRPIDGSNDLLDPIKTGNRTIYHILTDEDEGRNLLTFSCERFAYKISYHKDYAEQALSLAKLMIVNCQYDQ